MIPYPPQLSLPQEYRKQDPISDGLTGRERWYRLHRLRLFALLAQMVTAWSAASQLLLASADFGIHHFPKLMNGLTLKRRTWIEDLSRRVTLSSLNFS
jgi:hypothetical protein